MSAPLPSMADLIAALLTVAGGDLADAQRAGDLAEALSRFAATQRGERWANLRERLEDNILGGAYDVD